MACHTCGKQFQKPEAWAKRSERSFCSRPCYWQWRKTAPEVVDLLREVAATGRAGWTAASVASYQSKMTGENNPAWKGGVTYWRKHGNYKPIKYVRCPVEFLPMARKDGYVMEHRLVMARTLGRCLARTEVVHHIDHDPHNNHPDNLQLFPNNRAHKLAEGAERRASRQE